MFLKKKKKKKRNIKGRKKEINKEKERKKETLSQESPLEAPQLKLRPKKIEIKGNIKTCISGKRKKEKGGEKGEGRREKGEGRGKLTSKNPAQLKNSDML